MFNRNVVLLVLIIGAYAEEAVKSDRSEFKKSLKDCEKSYSTTCLKLDLVSWVDKLNEEVDYGVLPGVSLVRETSTKAAAGARANTADIVAELARDFPNDPDARLDAFLVKKISSYLSSHSLRLNLWNNPLNGEARGKEGGGFGGGKGDKKGGGGMEMILAAGAMMKGTMMTMALGGLAILAGKALMAGLISILISAIIGLKSLSNGKSTTYEVISKPVYTHANTHSVSHEAHGAEGGGGGGGGGGGHYGHSGYGRSFDMPLPLGLQEDYKPPQ